MKFAIGDLVVGKTGLHPHTNYSVDKVVAHLDGYLLVEYYGHAFDGEIHPMQDHLNEPGSRHWREAIQRFSEDAFFTPEEALEEIHRLEGNKSKLNEEFELIRNSIREKLSKAADLVREADAIAKPFEKDFYDLKEECMPLYRAMDNGGWSHSSMKC